MRTCAVFSCVVRRSPLTGRAAYDTKASERCLPIKPGYDDHGNHPSVWRGEQVETMLYDAPDVVVIMLGAGEHPPARGHGPVARPSAH